ncbi:hypothetical protein A2U01_0109364 [Trifolium medium]|uniref:Uncharacterized protein n=1 Tax=Trifolium medium TaxID=97028 RepID=A0A392VI53_9FABA|nr:hypothetical protein [Trifolium medium]
MFLRAAPGGLACAWRSGSGAGCDLEIL